MNNNIWIKVAIVGATLLVAFLIFHQFDTITSTVLNVRLDNCVEDTDVSEQEFHFEKMAPSRQKAILNPQKISNIETYLVPEITCSTAVRLGQVGDGGKWVCNPWRAPEDCVIYSFGVNGEVSFENGIYEATKNRCKIHCFDPGNMPEKIFTPFNGTFHRWAIVGKTNKNASRYSIPDVADYLGHSRIEFLKIDIETYEYESFETLFASDVYKNGNLEICQIFIEFHTHVTAWMTLQKALQNNGFYMFYKEANYYCAHCHEYSYINLNCARRYGIYGKPFNLNFA